MRCENVFCLIPKELSSYSTAFICGSVGALAVGMLYAPNILAAVRRALEPSNLTVDNFKIHTANGYLDSDMSYDLELDQKIRKITYRILNLTDVYVNNVGKALDESYTLGEFINVKGNEVWNNHLKIKVEKDQFFFCYAVALLHFIYKSNVYLKHFNIDYLRARIFRNPAVSVIIDVIKANSEQELMVILKRPYSINLVIQWIKSLAQPNLSYDFNKESLPQIEALFEKFGVYVNIAKEEDDFYFVAGIPKEKTLLKDVFVSVEAEAEFVLNEDEKNQLVIFQILDIFGLK